MFSMKTLLELGPGGTGFAKMTIRLLEQGGWETPFVKGKGEARMENEFRKAVGVFEEVEMAWKASCPVN